MAVLERMPVDRITTEAKDVRFGHTLLQVVTLVLYGLGWLVAKAFGVVWFALVWVAVAVKVGWSDGRQGAKTPAGRARGSA